MALALKLFYYRPTKSNKLLITVETGLIYATVNCADDLSKDIAAAAAAAAASRTTRTRKYS